MPARTADSEGRPSAPLPGTQPAGRARKRRSKTKKPSPAYSFSTKINRWLCRFCIMITSDAGQRSRLNWTFLDRTDGQRETDRERESVCVCVCVYVCVIRARQRTTDQSERTRKREQNSLPHPPRSPYWARCDTCNTRERLGSPRDSMLQRCPYRPYIVVPTDRHSFVALSIKPPSPSRFLLLHSPPSSGRARGPPRSLRQL